jgi:hypothetical protein
MIDRLKALWATEPALVVSALVAVIVFVCAKVGILVDEQTVSTSLGVILPILLTGAATRAKVSPAAPPLGPDSDALLAASGVDLPKE